MMTIDVFMQATDNPQCRVKQVRYPDVTVQLTGMDGNAWGILGRVSKALRAAGVEQKYIEEYNEQAMSGDYDNLLRTTMEWVEVA